MLVLLVPPPALGSHKPHDTNRVVDGDNSKPTELFDNVLHYRGWAYWLKGLGIVSTICLINQCLKAVIEW